MTFFSGDGGRGVGSAASEKLSNLLQIKHLVRLSWDSNLGLDAISHSLFPLYHIVFQSVMEKEPWAGTPAIGLLLGIFSSKVLLLNALLSRYHYLLQIPPCVIRFNQN